MGYKMKKDKMVISRLSVGVFSTAVACMSVALNSLESSMIAVFVSVICLLTILVND